MFIIFGFIHLDILLILRLIVYFLYFKMIHKLVYILSNYDTAPKFERSVSLVKGNKSSLKV